MLSRTFVTLSLPLENDRYKCEDQHLELSNILSFQAFHSFWFIANELQTCSLYLCPIENTHALYSKMVGACLATPTDTPTARGLYTQWRIQDLRKGGAKSIACEAHMYGKF